MNAVVAAVAAVMVIAMLVFLGTCRWSQKVAEAASFVMAWCLGFLFLWFVTVSIADGYIEGSKYSKLVRSRVVLAEDPVAFWWWVAFFGVPGLLLLWAGTLLIVKGLGAALARAGRALVSWAPGKRWP